MREWILARPAWPATAGAPLTEADLREAYARGRRDERARRRRSPPAMLTVSIAAFAGSGLLAISAWQGPFAHGGARTGEAAIGARGGLPPGAATPVRGPIGG